MSHYGEGGFAMDDNQHQGSSQRVIREQSLKPVTIKQVNDSVSANSDGEFSINGVDINTVEVVGVVRRVDGEREQSVDITIEDGTGSITVKKWLDTTQSKSEVLEHYNAMMSTWVRVCGQIKTLQERKTIAHPRIAPVANYNQVTNHFLRAIAVYVDAQGGSGGGGDAAPSKSLFVAETDESAGPASGSLRNRLLQFIRDNAPSMSEGVPTVFIAQGLGVGTDVVEAEAEQLRDDGTLYNGADDNTWMLVESF